MSRFDYSHQAAALAGQLVQIDVRSTEVVAPIRIQVVLRRLGRTPELVYRSFVVRENGRGRYRGWLPFDLIGLSVVLEGEFDFLAARVTIRRCSTLGGIAQLLAREPRGMFRVARLFAAGNIKGGIFRFARLTEMVSAPRYSDWIKAVERPALREPSRFEEWPTKPFVLISLDEVHGGVASETLATIAAQSYRYFAVVPSDRVGWYAKHQPEKEFLWMRLVAGMKLAPRALEWLVEPFALDPNVHAVYSDEDEVDLRGSRVNPIFKPAWNKALVESGWLPVDATLFRYSELAGLQDFPTTPTAQLLSEVEANAPASIRHVPRVLFHRPHKRKAREPLRPQLQLREYQVTVVIPTRDRADLLLTCLNGLFERTEGVQTDIVVIDNGSSEQKTISLFREMQGRIRCVPMPGEFNFSKACNIGVLAAEHEFVLLLNNDVVPISPNWLRHMAAEFQDDKVGAVGALLLFPDGFVQHAGVTLGAGSVARHSFHFVHPQSGEGRGLLTQRREVSAVTAACLLTRKSLWAQVAGMDEKDLAVAFNDVDYCLKIRRLGYKIMWTPEATLWHRESVSRGRDDTKEKRQRFSHEERTMHLRWGRVLQSDPFYNPNLSLVAEDFVLDASPRDLSARGTSLR